MTNPFSRKAPAPKAEEPTVPAAPVAKALPSFLRNKGSNPPPSATRPPPPPNPPPVPPKAKPVPVAEPEVEEVELPAAEVTVKPAKERYAATPTTKPAEPLPRGAQKRRVKKDWTLSRYRCTWKLLYSWTIVVLDPDKPVENKLVQIAEGLRLTISQIELDAYTEVIK